ncbi:TetR/AcrR family transcriptional regulator C-terminal domain-containing protein [Arthrobacter sp. UYEF3]|uniref:TetR/AcrR family transcriptional regulator n=1 Tax=Arthrobacter sp. UYEF3 TaxID=1756365 RepID=UPI00339A7FE4
MAPGLAAPRTRLNRDRVLQAAVELADEIGLEALSMRRLAEELGVVPMALYKHVANKEELLDAMVEVIINEIDPPISSTDWKTAVRLRIISARQVLMRHPWARPVLESRTNHTPTVLDYLESTIGMFLTGGFSVDLTHHVMHALGSRMWGFTQELFDQSPSSGSAAAAETAPEVQSAQTLAVAERYPNIARISGAADHDGTVVAHGCDDRFEFEFALDLLLDGFERLHQTGWRPPGRS